MKNFKFGIYRSFIKNFKNEYSRDPTQEEILEDMEGQISKKIIENVVLFSILAGTIITLIIFITRKFISKILIDDNPLYIAMLSAVIPIIMVSSIFSILARGLKRFDIYNYFVLIKPFVFFHEVLLPY